jgi:hypothetical protein
VRILPKVETRNNFLEVNSLSCSECEKLKAEIQRLTKAIEDNAGHWYEPGYGLKCWKPDKWVVPVLGFVPKADSAIGVGNG